MRSTLLLLWVFRRRLFLFAAIYAAFIFYACYSFAEQVQWDMERGHNCALLHPLILIALVVGFLGLERRLLSLPIPVSCRQAAWFPTLVLCLVWLAGLLSMFLALSLVYLNHEISMHTCMLYTGRVVEKILFYLLLAILYFRVSNPQQHVVVSASMVLALFAFMIEGMIGKPMESLTLNYCIQHFNLYFIPLILFFLYEGPINISTRDHSHDAASSQFDLKSAMVNTSRIHHPVVLLGDFITLSLFLSFSGYVFISNYPFKLAGTPFEYVVPIVPYVLIVFALVVLVQIYRNTRANGYGLLVALLISLLRMTLILEPIFNALGVRRGFTIKCSECKNYKFMWATNCPHCQSVEDGAANAAMLEKLRNSRLHGDRMSYFYRIGIILIILMSYTLLPFASLNVFVQKSQTLFLHQITVSEERETIVQNIRELVEGVSDPTALCSDGDAKRIPGKYRIIVEDWSGEDGGYIKIECLSYRWEADGRDLCQSLVDYITDNLGPNNQLHINKNDREDYGGTLNPLQIGEHLDNRIHWIDNREKAERYRRDRSGSHREPPKPVPRISAEEYRD
jgi:hypothetical protein